MTGWTRAAPAGRWQRGRPTLEMTRVFRAIGAVDDLSATRAPHNAQSVAIWIITSTDAARGLHSHKRITTLGASVHVCQNGECRCSPLAWSLS